MCLKKNTTVKKLTFHLNLKINWEKETKINQILIHYYMKFIIMNHLNRHQKCISQLHSLQYEF